MALQFESNLQNLVYQVDSGASRKVIQAVLFALFAFALAALYTFANFQGLNSPRAMEEAQLARSLAEHGTLVTQSVRPFALARAAARAPDGQASAFAQPDLRHPPLWPALLAGAFRLGGMPQPGVPNSAHVYAWDYVVVGLNHFFTALAALLVWLIGRKLFDARVGALSVGAFLASDLVWRRSLEGADWSAALFFGLGAVYAAIALVKLPPGVGPQEDQGPAWRWLLPLASAALLAAAAFLTRYAAAAFALLIFFYIGTSRRRRPWAKAGLFLLLAALAAAPWLIRNVRLSGHPFGLLFHETLAGTFLFPGDALARSLQPELPGAGTVVYAVQLKMIENFREFCARGIGTADTALLLGLFAAMYFHRFVRPASRTLRWCLLPAAAAVMLAATAFGAETLPALAFFWPLAIPYAWAFFLVLLDRLQFDVRFFPAAAMSAVMAVTALPLLANVLPPRTGIPYPPYSHRYIGWVSGMVQPEEGLVTDIPWAMAWYGGRTAIQLPRNIDGFYELHGRYQPIALAYFTTVTRNKPWVRSLADSDAPEHSWYQIFEAGKVPANFPLAHGRFAARSDQMILADRPRW